MRDGGIEVKIKDEARKLGFSFCGFARNEPLENLRQFYSDFIQRDGHAGLNYLKTNLEKRLDPGLVLEGTKSVITLLMNYYPATEISGDDNFIISKYAYGRDYHRILREKMELLINYMHEVAGECKSKSFVDSGPVLEKAWAQRCGVGWQGKNTLIINPKAGSFFFIGIILTDLELIPDISESDHCGECRRCMDACPTGALDTPYQLNIRKCISYYNVEKKEVLPDELKAKLNDRIFGCDICQDVCPYNRFASPAPEPLFAPAAELISMKKVNWTELTPVLFQQLFSGTPVERCGYAKLMQNIRLNSGAS